MSQKHRPSLSQTIANAGMTLARLATPPSAVRSKRQSKPHHRPESTSAAPTPERASKEPLPMELVLHAGGQISHAPKHWVDEYGHHLKEEGDEEALQILLKAWEIATRVRMISNRAYTGAPYTGVAPDHEGHVPMSQRDRRAMELFAFAVEHLTAHDKEWWELLKVHILRESNRADGRIPTMAELGALLTAYKPKSQDARTAGVASMRMVVKRWKEALRAGAMKQQYAKMRRQALHEEAATRWVDERRVRLKIESKR